MTNEPSRTDVLGEAYDRLAAEPSTTAAPEAATTTTTPPPVTATEPATQDRARDDKGRFASTTEKPADAPKGAQKADDATATAGPAKAEGETTPPPISPSATATTEPQERPPQSWKPLAREKWKDAPPEIRAEAIRREREIQAALQETAEARKNWDHISKLVEGRESNPVQAFGNYVQTVRALESAIPGQVAQTFAAAIKHYGTQRFGPQFVEMLAAALDGQMPAAAQVPIQPAIDPRVAVRAELDAYLDQARQAKIESSLETFGTNHEFFEDVRDTMADLVEAAGKRGVALGLEDAYNRALMLDPELSKVVEQRKASQAAKVQTTSTAQAKAAASSIKPQPAAAPTAQPTDRRAVLAAKYDEIASR